MHCPDCSEDDVVVASDQICAIDEERLGKPGSVAAAHDQLARLAGRAHELHTAVHVRHGPVAHAWVDTTRLWMRALSREEIEAYVRADSPLDCAGAYKLEALGIALFERIETEDATAITGLPLMRLAAVLRECGFRVP